MCNCCGISYRFTFTSKSDHVLCQECRLHQRRTQEVIERRNIEHIKSWQQAMSQLAATHRGALDTERTTIAKLKEDIAIRDEKIEELRTSVKALTEETQRVLTESLKGQAREPGERVLSLLANTVAEQANVEKQTAFRIRDYAMARLWVVDEIHHADDEKNGHCTCGEDLAKCAVYEALAPIRNALYKWEIHQVERLEKNLSHGLPAEHAEVMKRQKTYRKIG